MEEYIERYELASGRVSCIISEGIREDMPERYSSFFAAMFGELAKQFKAYENREKRKGFTLDELRKENQSLYEMKSDKVYDCSYYNPDYAVSVFGEYGQLMSFLITEVTSAVTAAFTGFVNEIVIRAELALQVYSAFEAELDESGRIPKLETLHDILYYYVFDYQDMVTDARTLSRVDASCPESAFFTDIISKSTKDDIRYLYYYGVPISENEEKTALLLGKESDEVINLMADTYTEGYRIGFVNGRKDLSKKKTVELRYQPGFELMMKRAILNFGKMGLSPVIYRDFYNIFIKNTGASLLAGHCVNYQLLFDHRDDLGLFLNGNLKTRCIETLKESFEAVKDKAVVHAGPAVVEVFGEEPFSPKVCENAVKLSEEQRSLYLAMTRDRAKIINEYIPGDERSFTIIAFPLPEIGEKYEEIFKEVIKLNTLDYVKYQNIQQRLIDELDEADYVEIKGKDGNETDLRVNIVTLSDKSAQTAFENCVADVNIPVGEVFTSPVLKGTNGILNVKEVFLEGLKYINLKVVFEDGMTKSVSCDNFEDPSEGEKYINDNVLFHNKSLPMGEFAIGTNTTAYVMAGRYNIADKLPILIAEKTGPHFAVGDTCYSHSEDTPVYNPDGKEIIARDNEVSVKRKDNSGEAYFGCHTDITIPYDELGSITVCRKDNTRVDLIRDGRFVLAGTEGLNEAFDQV